MNPAFPIAVALCALGAPPHPDSLSSSRVTVDGRLVLVESKAQVASWREVVPELDPERDLAVTPADVERVRPEIEAYLRDHYRVWTGTERDFGGGVQLVPQFKQVELVVEEALGLSNYRDWIDVRFQLRHTEDVRDVLVHATLFEDTSPGHYDVCTIEWVGGAQTTRTLDATTPRVRFDPEGRGAFSVFLRMGIGHILSGWDHLAFVAVLLFATRGLRALLGVVTAFTLAHSITLGLAALGVVDVGRFERHVEAAIALSIAYVASETLIDVQRKRSPWIEAFCFGLVHGLGFAGFLGRALVDERAQATALAGFNVGVEAGQLAVVALLLALLWPLARLSRAQEPAPAEASTGAAGAAFLAPLVVRRTGSAIVGILGLYWFFERL